MGFHWLASPWKSHSKSTLNPGGGESATPSRSNTSKTQGKKALFSAVRRATRKEPKKRTPRPKCKNKNDEGTRQRHFDTLKLAESVPRTGLRLVTALGRHGRQPFLAPALAADSPTFADFWLGRMSAGKNQVDRFTDLRSHLRSAWSWHASMATCVEYPSLSRLVLLCAAGASLSPGRSMTTHFVN